MAEKRVLLIVGGGIAAYKALELTRLLRKAGVGVRPILTQAGARFVTPLSLSALAEDKVYSELFDLTAEAEMGHIELSRSADLVVVAPATADLMAKAAAGLAGDLASTTLLATDKPVLMAPAMNVRMWEHPATRRNRAQLQADGVLFVGPDEGAMACGEYGPGRMAEPSAIFEAIMTALSGPAARPLAGRRAVITAGPTAEPIDPVRLLTNRSSGKQGYAIAQALAVLGAEVTLVSGPTALSAPAGVRRVLVETAREMLAACEAALPADIAVCVAAVADWRPETVGVGKIKKAGGDAPTIRLVENPDILATLSRSARRPKLVVGFAAETDDVEAHARAKLARKGCDWIVANDVSVEGTMGGDENAVAIVSGAGIERWDRMAKGEVARRLAARIAEEF
ncbi:bifunctional phosphopantothenoylcysteine decarboxylase/phosphopantothenate--cysteine ligase CoaBC [Phenylobacterium sp. SCN 70-31]|uniref:bifunctional phosphopantothenoylcysteine decarboxylase/phosphopantothenate--cysteine ligase CoaBC n=1 Tax=Phenylobacterium sp. SCN 70-31 TaxID=1660129 RepID=UPI00086BA089|nr:bifunctional phosphopantothenoylcysteine decarboxylase/phosphopantothenate--cysteine ligase CoaBC [Phenylobacterium sp. SCN 70-31]ODT89212.1 MAG: bifunctional phosphopantothenoylcysteine decarboxylase/phosphopantothenate synthase [Phenylobacterium sp. SCN 70-31]